MYNRDENTKSKLKYIYIFTAPRRSSSRHAHVRSQCKKKSTVYGIRIRETDTDGKSHDEVHPRQYMQAGRVGNIGTLEHWNLGTLEPWNLGTTVDPVDVPFPRFPRSLQGTRPWYWSGDRRS